MSSEFAIEVNQLCKSYHIFKNPKDRLKQIFFGWHRQYYDEFHALKNVSFRVEKGKSVGVVGRNGAGKSTLLQLITGTLSPTSGSVTVNGRVAAVLELGSGFNPEFTGRENVYLYASLFNVDRKALDERFKKIVDFAELWDFIEQPVKTYSSGMQARLAFAVVAHVDAEILIIDEALSVGDAFFSQKCMRFLREFQKTGTIFFVSHDLGAVTAFCDHAIWLEGGAVRDAGTAKDICEKYYSKTAETQKENALISTEDADANINDQSSRSFDVIAETAVMHEVTIEAKDSDEVKGLQIIEAFGFNINSKDFGSGEAKITDVQFVDENEKKLSVSEGGKNVKVKVMVEAKHDVNMPIVGFIVKDRLGQPLFGGNTYHAYKFSDLSIPKGKLLVVVFEFKLPILMVGDYSICAAVAVGTLQSHSQLHWMHDAFLFKVVSSSIEGVIVGVSLDKISLSILE